MKQKFVNISKAILILKEQGYAVYASKILDQFIKDIGYSTKYFKNTKYDIKESDLEGKLDFIAKHLELGKKVENEGHVKENKKSFWSSVTSFFSKRPDDYLPVEGPSFEPSVAYSENR